MSCLGLSQPVWRDAAGFPAGPCLAAALMMGCAPLLGELSVPPVPRAAAVLSEPAERLAADGAVARLAAVDMPVPKAVRSEPALREGLGVNFLSVGWTKQWRCAVCPQGLTTNLTAGFSTPEEAGQFLSDVQYVFQVPRSGLSRPRHSADDLVEASLANLFSNQPKHQNEDVKKVLNNSFVRGAGGGGGSSLNKELFGRPGVRRLSLPLDVGLPEHLSLMGRVNLREQFWSLSYRHEGLKIEFWNHHLYNHSDQSGLGFGLAYHRSWNSTYPFK